MSTLVERALKFEETSLKALTTNERIIISREAKELILGLIEIYKEEKDPTIMYKINIIYNFPQYVC